MEKARPRASTAAYAITAIGFAGLYIPILALFVISFVIWAPGTPLSEALFTTQWFRRMLDHPDTLASLNRSLWVGVITLLFSTVLGTLLALSLERSQVRAKNLISLLTLVPLITPEIVLGLSLLIWFVILQITLGLFSVILAHITFCISYVVVTVQARLAGFDRSVEEAGLDLGASPAQVFWRITLPLIQPGVVAGALMAFTISFDDFLITFFTSGVGSDTLPVRLYSLIKYGITPEINALCSTIIVATFLLVSVFFSSFSKGHS